MLRCLSGGSIPLSNYGNDFILFKETKKEKQMKEAETDWKGVILLISHWSILDTQ
jgi:hypothetical protein